VCGYRVARDWREGYECRVTLISPLTAVDPGTHSDVDPGLGTAVEPVLRLAAADRSRCSDLALSREWGAEEHKWNLLFEVGEVYGIEDAEGRLLATAVLTRYGTRLASVSMVLVAEDRERQGYGTAIMRHLIEQAAGATVVLHATQAGRPLYESLGFTAFGTVETHVGRFDPTGIATGRSQPAAPADLLQLARLDHEVYGVHRTAVVKRLPAFADRIRVLRNEEGLLTGYGASWRNGETTMLGPVLAPDFAGARDLIADLVDGVEGELRVDVDTEADDLSAWVCGHGLKPGYACTHMALGGTPPMDVSRLHAPLMCALG
jgi:GNAT superfamily N-acetyltransferase